MKVFRARLSNYLKYQNCSLWDVEAMEKPLTPQLGKHTGPRVHLTIAYIPPGTSPKYRVVRGPPEEQLLEGLLPRVGMRCPGQATIL